MTNIDDLKRTWRQINVEAPQITDSGRKNSDSRDSDDRIKSYKRLLLESESVPTVKQRLISRLKRPTFAAGACLASIALLIRDFDIPLWFIVIYCAFVVAAMALTLYQIRLLKNTNFATMTTVEAISFIRRFTIMRQRCKAALLSMGIPIVVVLMWLLDSHKEPALLIGGIAGAVIGAALGFYMNHRFKKDLRLIEDTLGKIEEI